MRNKFPFPYEPQLAKELGPYLEIKERGSAADAMAGWGGSVATSNRGFLGGA